eukprot:PhM_4_TR3394/c1_g1_i1/m.18507/K10396/KIF5; kinesin family member 5
MRQSTPRGGTTPRGQATTPRTTPRGGTTPPNATPRDKSARGTFRGRRGQGSATPITVCVRVRPPGPGVGSSSDLVPYHTDGTSFSMSVKEEQRTYDFAKVFDVATDEPDVYEYLWPQVREQLRAGYNATILCYGQTGSGKTHTLNNLTPTLLQSIFRYSCEASESPVQYTYTYEMTYLQIYKDVVYDLLERSPEGRLGSPLPKPCGLRVSEPRTSIISCEEALRHIDQAQQRRATAPHALNNKSSRSHTLLFLYVTRCLDGVPIMSSKVAVIDLAGSERAKRTGATGEVFEEGRAINRSLSALSRVMESLTMPNVGVPYRENILTLYLNQSLTNSYFALIANVSPEASNADETRGTLDFATVAKKVVVTRTHNTTRPRRDEWNEVNEGELEGVQVQLLSEIAKLQSRIEVLLVEVENSRARELEMRERISTLESDVETSQVLQEQLAQTRNMAQVLDAQTEEFRTLLREREDELREMQRVLDERRLRGAEMESLKERCSELETKHDMAQQKARAAEAEVRRWTEREDELRARERAVAAMEAEYLFLRGVKEKQAIELDELRAHLTVGPAEAATETSDDGVRLDATTQGLIAKVAQLQADNDSLVERNRDLEGTVDNLTDTLTIMKEHERRLEETVQDKDDILQRAYSELDAQNVLVETLQDRLDMATHRGEEWAARYESVTAEYDKVKSQLAHSAANASQDSIERLQKRLKTLEVERSQALAELRTMQKDSQRWHRMLQEKQSDLQRALEKVRGLESGNEKLQRHNGLLSKQVRGLTQRENVVNTKLRTVSQKNTALTERYENLRSTCASLSLNNERLKHESRVLTHEVTQLRMTGRSGSKSPLVTCTSTRTNNSSDDAAFIPSSAHHSHPHHQHARFSRHPSTLSTTPPTYDEATTTTNDAHSVGTLTKRSLVMTKRSVNVKY